jgi:hypothetical protein
VLIYVFWIVYIVCRGCADVKVIPALGPRLKFFSIFTLIVLIIAIAGVVFGFVQPDENNGMQNNLHSDTLFYSLSHLSLFQPPNSLPISVCSICMCLFWHSSICHPEMLMLPIQMLFLKVKTLMLFDWKRKTMHRSIQTINKQ